MGPAGLCKLPRRDSGAFKVEHSALDGVGIGDPTLLAIMALEGVKLVITETILTLIVTISSVHQGVATIDKGRMAGLEVGDVGLIYYQLTVGAETKRIDVGEGTLVEVEDSQSLLEINGEVVVRPSYLVEFDLPRPPSGSEEAGLTVESESALRSETEEVASRDQEESAEFAARQQALQDELNKAQADIAGLTRQLGLADIAQRKLLDELAVTRSELSRLRIAERCPETEASPEVEGPPEIEVSTEDEVPPETGGSPELETPTTEIPESLPQPDAPASRKAKVLAMVRDWAGAWSDQRVDDYLAFYAPGFQPPEGQSRSEWESHRRARIQGPSFIEVTVENPEILAMEAGSARVQLRQLYRSDTIKVAANKILELVEEDGRWKILAEILQ